MRPGNPEPTHQLLWNARWLIALAALLALVAMRGWMTDTPVRSLFPFGIAVGLVSWHHGLNAGFVFAGLGTLAALRLARFRATKGCEGRNSAKGCTPTSSSRQWCWVFR